MANNVQAIRLSVLAFDDADCVANAVGAILEQGVSFDQVCLVGQRKHLIAIALPTAFFDPHCATIVDWRTFSPSPVERDCPVNIEARGGVEVQELLGLSGPAARQTIWMQRDFTYPLGAMAARGSMILVVNSQSSKQHGDVARTLLRHGRHNLQTFEFTRRVR